jgi:hypothetical protein
MAESRVLFAVLDWGLGHATRCVPLISQLQREGHEVIIAGAGHSLAWLKLRFPELKAIEKPNAAIRYTRKANGINIAAQMPRFLGNIRKEQDWTSQMVRKFGLTGLYSDNCYGVKHPDLPSVFMTHQLHFPVSFLARPAAGWSVKRMVRGFTTIWVPDLEGDKALAGRLSAPLKGCPITYIGPISQYTEVEADTLEEAVPNVAMISGPEPHRSLMEADVIKRFQATGQKSVLFTGKVDATVEVHGKVTVYGNAPASTIKAHLVQAEQIVCRSGYSTVMDLHVLGVIDRVQRWEPTPGQWEQEYIAKHLNRRRKSRRRS